MNRAIPAIDHRLQRWSTSTVEPAHRAAFWAEAVCEAFLEMNVAIRSRAGFSGELLSAPLGDIRLNRVESGPSDVERSPRSIARGAGDCLYLLTSTNGAWKSRQQEREALVNAGDLVLIDARRPYLFRFSEPSTALSIQLPVAWAERWLPDPAAHAGSRIDGAHGWGAALGAFVRQLQPELACAPPLPAALLSDQLGALLSLASTPAGPAECRTVQLRDSVTSALRDRYGEAGLTAAHIARQLGVSTRTLHRCLADSNTTFGSQLMDMRMTAARQMLTDRRFDRLTLAEIGRRVGLREPSHFARQIRRHFGKVPSDLRRTL